MSLEANLLTVGDLLYTKPKCWRDFQQKGAEGECRCANSGSGGGGGEQLCTAATQFMQL